VARTERIPVEAARQAAVIIQGCATRPRPTTASPSHKIRANDARVRREE
jgi:hypothetical protein